MSQSAIIVKTILHVVIRHFSTYRFTLNDSIIPDRNIVFFSGFVYLLNYYIDNITSRDFKDLF